MRTTMTKESLLQIIIQVDADPLAGMGSISKRDLLVDRLLAHFNTVEPRQTMTTIARPIITEVAGDVLDLKIASK